MQVHAYQLLFRRGLEGALEDLDPVAVTEGGVSAWLFASGVERMAGDRPAIVTIPRPLLLDGFPTLLDPSLLWIEISASTAADEDVIQAVKSLRESGFRMVVSGPVLGSTRRAFIDMADYLRVDVDGIEASQKADIEQMCADNGVDMLAAGVRTSEEFHDLLDRGYQLLEGRFFVEPKVAAGRNIAVPKVHYWRLVQEINRPEFSFAELSEIVRRDAALSYKLLRYINSAAFGWRKKVQSIRHALVLLGEQEIRRWATLAALGGTVEDRPQELLTSCVVRGRMCELLADRLGLANRAVDFFFLGMLSRFDEVMGVPMRDVLAGIDVSPDVRDALIRPGSSGALAGALALVSSYEVGDWPAVEAGIDRLGVDGALIPPLYLNSLEWSEALFRSRH
jgi:EAL and modified HD-GYP domain-containing signal transduction protein